MTYRYATLFILLTSMMIVCNCSSSPEAPEDFPVFEASGISVEEGDSPKNIFITLTLSKPSYDSIIVFATAVDGTAIVDEDFTELDLYPIIFIPGDLREELAIEIIGDETFETDEQFEIEFIGGEGVETGTSSVVIELLNDDIDTSLKIPETGYSTPETYDGMTLVWQDEFSGDKLNEQDWTYEYGGGGWGNNELQYYRKENTSIVEGHLVIEARKESYGGRSYTSSRLITRDKNEFKYGRMDIRAALPYGQGIWPAIWMLGGNINDGVGWPACGEIDIMEMIGGTNRDKTSHGTLHWSNANSQHAFQGGSYSLSSGIFADEFHVFSIIWDEDKVRWYVDDVNFYTLSTTDPTMTEFDLPHFFILNVAVGGNWPGSPNDDTVFPQRMIVDYVRVFQNN